MHWACTKAVGYTASEAEERHERIDRNLVMESHWEEIKERLTDGLIDTLQNYYGMAIPNHSGDVQGMAKAIWAGSLHRLSTDDKPQHQFCPTGADAWCGWQRVQAGSDEEYLHHNIMPEAGFEVIKPTYISLTDKALLQQCLRGATQNLNEAFNAMIWNLCPKQAFAGAEVVEISAHLAAARFNHGAATFLAELREMGCTTGCFIEAYLRVEDAARVRQAEVKAGERQIKRRKTLRKRKKGYEEKAVEAEGQTYEPGAF